jgi:hypothetical protein
MAIPHESPPYKVIISLPYQDKLTEYKKTFQHMENIHKGIIFALERDPYTGTEEIPNMIDHRIMKTYDVSPHTDFYVLYRINDIKNEVYLLSIASTGIIM